MPRSEAHPSAQARKDYVVINGLRHGDTLTLDQLVEDTAQLTEHVLTSRGRERAVLMSHSWGAYLGAVTAARHPSVYSAYIGVGQPNRLADGERVTWHYLPTARPSTSRDDSGPRSRTCSPRTPREPDLDGVN